MATEEDWKSRPRPFASSAMRAVGLAADFTSILTPSASGAAFDSVTDFSKMNAGRHQAGKQNTFNTPVSLVKPFTPAAASQRQKSAQGVATTGATRELLDVFEMGVSRNMVNLRNELREELAVSTDALRADVMAAIADMRGLDLLMRVDAKIDWIKQGPVNVDFQQVLDEIRLTHTSIRDALQNSTHAIVKQVGQQTMQLGSDLRTLTSEQNVLLKEHHESASADLESRCELIVSKLDASLELQGDQGTAAERGRAEVRTMQQENKDYQGSAAAAASQCAEREGSLLASVARMEQELKSIHELDLAIQRAQQDCTALVAHHKQDSTYHNERMLPSIRDVFNSELEEHRVDVDLSPVLRLVSSLLQIHSVMIPKMMGEIGKIQQAVEVDFCSEGEYAAEMSQLRSGFGIMIGQTSMAATNSMAADRGAVAFMCDPPLVPAGGTRECRASWSPQEPWSERMASRDSTTEFGPTAAESRSGSKHHSMKAAKSKRVRHYWCQTDASGTADGSCQTEGESHMALGVAAVSARRMSLQAVKSVKRPDMKSKAIKQKQTEMRRRSQQMMKPVFADSESMKQRARKALIRPQYRTTDMYWETGCAQKIAKSAWFEYVTLLMICLNAVWISVDADLNKAAMLLQADPIFQVADNTFCIYFLWELLTRFFAFKRKASCFKDRWFIFDSILVALMVLETWVISLVFYLLNTEGTANLSNLSLLRIIRMVKLLRISRMARLMRGLPELFILLKGLRAASRSVALFWALWWIIIYVYALVFRLINDGDSLYFESIPEAMNSLLLDGILPNHAQYIRDVTKEHWVFWPIALSFIAIAYVLLMNMLVGVLVEVVQAIAVTEKEGITVVSLATDLRNCLIMHQISTDRGLSKESIDKMLSETDFAVVLENAGADVITLADMLHAIFEDQGDEDGLITFEDLVDNILNLRGANPAKVKDVKGQLRAFKGAMKEVEANLRSALFDELTVVKEVLYAALEHTNGRIDTVTSDEDFVRFGATSDAGSNVSRGD